jgi:phosphoribosylamine-glycine ligase
MLEYNCRFGDPETQVLLPLLETDLYEVFIACCDGTLGTVDVRFKENTCAATVVCAASGYPETYPKGMGITGIDAANAIAGVKVYHAGTMLDENSFTRCSGGRVLAITGMGPSFTDALGASYKAIEGLNFVGSNKESLMHYRTDIAKGVLN